MPLSRALSALLLATALGCGGCQSTMSVATSPVATTVPFDPKEAAFIKKAGNAKIAGHAFWRDGEGGTMNAAGEVIRLVPATGYARARFATLYGGKRTIAGSAIPHVDTDPAYSDYTRTTRAESNGHFEFDSVAPGTYLVTAQIVYKTKRQGLISGSSGGAMYDTVTITGKEDGPVKLVLTNER